jgi:hypothetical protein
MLIIVPLCIAEFQNSVVVRKESTDDFDAHDDGWSELLHLEKPVEEAREKGKDLEFSSQNWKSTSIREPGSDTRRDGREFGGTSQKSSSS